MGKLVCSVCVCMINVLLLICGMFKLVIKRFMVCGLMVNLFSVLIGLVKLIGFIFMLES